MLIEQLQNMQALLVARDERRSEKKSLQGLSNQEEFFKGFLTRWQGLAQVAKSLGREDAIIQQFHKDLHAIVERFEAEIPIQQNDFRQLQERTSELESDLQVRWTHYRQRLIDDALLARARIALVISTPQVRITLHQTYSRLNNLLNLSFPTANEFSALTKAQAQMENELSRALPTMSPEVESFLEKLYVEQATLIDLSPTIVTWCRDQHLLEQISLRFTGG